MLRSMCMPRELKRSPVCCLTCFRAFGNRDTFLGDTSLLIGIARVFDGLNDSIAGTNVYKQV